MPRRLQVALLLLLTGMAGYAHALTNQLTHHPSPYLAMHGEDPVAWQEWGPAAFALGREQNKLLFVSSGYFSCHWCHVMQRESYRDPRIAALINQSFIPVKIDRELNPALDAYLVSFLENTQGYSGWPLNVFITPQGHPLVGLVYLPPAEFTTLLTKVAHLWQGESKHLSSDAAAAAAELAALQRPPAPHTPDGHDLASYRDALLQQAHPLMDTLQGGFGEPTKFPMVPQLQALLDLYRQGRDPTLKAFLTLTLDQMASQGLRDQLGGGFFRYTVDPGWQVPHFEKMLYDNAQLASLYLDAAAVFGQVEYQRIGLDTLDFMLRELQHRDGGFAASLSAIDDHDIEGGYYLWHSEELKRLLTAEEYQLASRYWKLDGAPALEEGYHAVQAVSVTELARQVQRDPAAVATTLERARLKLLKARQARNLPRDDKRLAAWNGLALTALARAVTLTDRADYREAAGRTASYLSQVLWNGKELQRAVSAQGTLGQAGVDDYAYVAQGLWAWQQAGGKLKDRRLPLRLVQQGWQRFYQAGWTRSEEGFLQYGNRETLLTDDTLPSPAALLVQLALVIGAAEKDAALQQRARTALTYVHTTLAAEPFWYVGYLAPVQMAYGKQ